MISIRKANDRGHTKIDWLDSRHSFSFGDYFDPKENGFSVLRVINDDRVAAGQGFGTHPHRDMEIITYVLEGAVEHRDSLGTRSMIPAGDVQRMTAGSGIRHSEFNPSASAGLHFLQIWILPEAAGLQPGYEQQTLGDRTKGKLALAASHDGADGALKINQDADLYIGSFSRGQAAAKAIAPGRNAYIHVARGKASVNGIALSEGDGAKISGETNLQVAAADDAEVLLFDLP
ncbi:MAG: pirin family protein [Candidatus Binataceae bacterium]|jgi:redox-sensitive bicupin YhaK (pirin superfamily)